MSEPQPSSQDSEVSADIEKTEPNEKIREGSPPIVESPDNPIGDSNIDQSVGPAVNELEEEEENSEEIGDDEEGEELADSGDEGQDGQAKVGKKRRRKKRSPKKDAIERRLLGRRAMCKSVAEIAPDMLKTVKLRVLGRHLPSTKGMDEKALEEAIIKDAKKLTEKRRILNALAQVDPDVNRRNLKEIIIYAILLQEETYSLEEAKLDEKVIQFEKALIKESKGLDFFDVKRHDPLRWHHYDTYRIVLTAAWRNEDVSEDEAALLRVLMDHLSISREEHWLIGAYIKRFPKAKCELHTPDDIHDARKELQREGILYSYRDENNKNIDVIPHEVVKILREDVLHMDLQKTNFERLLQHDSIRLSDLRKILDAKNMDKHGNKPEYIDRLVKSDVRATVILDELEKGKLAEMCRLVGIKSSGSKPELILRLVDFYDDLTFEERETQDKREEWYNNYELLASRAYADLKAKKIINKDLDIEHQFEKATDFLFETKLKVKIDSSRKVSKVDGRIPLDNHEVIVWDCKSVEKEVNLQDFLEDQFDGYLRKEQTGGRMPLAFLVIGPGFSKQSITLAHKYKAQTNWDIALVTAEALKFLAEQWSATNTERPFPIRLLNRTEVIDKERAEFLLSLA